MSRSAVRIPNAIDYAIVRLMIADLFLGSLAYVDTTLAFCTAALAFLVTERVQILLAWRRERRGADPHHLPEERYVALDRRRMPEAGGIRSA